MTTLKEKILEILKKDIKIDYKGGWAHEEYHSIPYIKDELLIEIAKELASLKLDMPTDKEIHFMGKNKYDIDLTQEGEMKQKILQIANIYREGLKDMCSEIERRNK